MSWEYQVRRDGSKWKVVAVDAATGEDSPFQAARWDYFDNERSATARANECKNEEELLRQFLKYCEQYKLPRVPETFSEWRSKQ